MNATAVETLERRLDATRRALIGEQERLTTAREQAAHAAGYVLQVEDGIRKSEQIIADLTAALDELRGWAPEAVVSSVPADAELLRRPTYDVPCPSCGALSGEPCHTVNGRLPLKLAHATRGAPS